MNIIKATKNQLIEIHKLSHKIWPIAYKDVISKSQIEYMLDMMYSVASLENQFDNDNVFLLVEENNNFVGYASYEINIDNTSKTKLHKLYVLPETQGKGYGKSLINAIKEEAIKNNNSSIFLNVNKKNIAKDFYLNYGFIIAEETVLNIGNDFVMDDYIMEFKLK